MCARKLLVVALERPEPGGQTVNVEGPFAKPFGKSQFIEGVTTVPIETQLRDQKLLPVCFFAGGVLGEELSRPQFSGGHVEIALQQIAAISSVVCQAIARRDMHGIKGRVALLDGGVNDVFQARLLQARQIQSFPIRVKDPREAESPQAAAASQG